MNKFIKLVALGVLVAASTVLVQGCAETKLVAQHKDTDVTAVYMAIADSKNKQETISTLVANGKNPDLVASVATVAGVALEVIEAALPAIPENRLIAGVTAANADPVAFSPSAASGPAQPDNGDSSKKLRSIRNPY